MKRTILIATIMILLLPQLSWGQIPQTMSYQGVVTDASGVAVNGDMVLTFTLWDAAAEGTQLWTETQSAIPVSSGIFNVILGSVNPLNIPFDEQYWLGVKVGTDSELTPRVQLTSSPYSLSTQLDSDLTTIAGFTHTDGKFIVSDGTKWVLENGATARTSLELGNMALQSSDAVDINGGAIDGSIIGATTPGAGTFTSLDVEGTATATAFVGDGSALTNLPGGGTVSSITAGTGLTGGTITTTGTIAVDVGTTADKIVQLDGQRQAACGRWLGTYEPARWWWRNGYFHHSRNGPDRRDHNHHGHHSCRRGYHCQQDRTTGRQRQAACGGWLCTYEPARWHRYLRYRFSPIGVHRGRLTQHEFEQFGSDSWNLFQADSNGQGSGDIRDYSFRG